jgi:hypothetical protein
MVGWRRLELCILGGSLQSLRGLAGQSRRGRSRRKQPRVCECGAHPPGPPRIARYALCGRTGRHEPYAKFAAPYDTNYTHPNIYVGAARDIPEPKDVTEVRIGFFGPDRTQFGIGSWTAHAARRAVGGGRGQCGGGYGGKPFKLMLHNDYNNWQAKAVYGDVRPTDPAIWGSASDEAVKMAYDDQVWAIFGSISSESTHIALRVALRAELPVVSSANTDPTVPETTIPWYFGTMQDDRQQYLTLARRIYTELGLKRVAVLRVKQPIRPLWPWQIPRCLAPAGPSGGDGADLSARRHGLFQATEGDPQLAPGRRLSGGR